MRRRLIDPGPFTFHELNLPHATDADLDKARRVRDKWRPGVEFSFGLYEVPMCELLESLLIDTVLRKQLPRQVYADWRARGAREKDLRELFAAADAQQRRSAGFAGELPAVEAIESLLADDATLDPLIAASLEAPLSTGEEALFVLDGRHRLMAARSAQLDALHVYIGTAKSARQ